MEYSIEGTGKNHTVPYLIYIYINIDLYFSEYDFDFWSAQQISFLDQI